MRTRAPDRGAHRIGLVAARIVHDDDVAVIGRRNQLRFDIGPEGVAVGRTVQNQGASIRSFLRAAMNVKQLYLAEVKIRVESGR